MTGVSVITCALKFNLASKTSKKETSLKSFFKKEKRQSLFIHKAGAQWPVLEHYFPTSKDPQTAKEWMRDPLVIEPGTFSLSVQDQLLKIAIDSSP